MTTIDLLQPTTSRTYDVVVGVYDVEIQYEKDWDRLKSIQSFSTILIKVELQMIFFASKAKKYHL